MVRAAHRNIETQISFTDKFSMLILLALRNWKLPTSASTVANRIRPKPIHASTLCLIMRQQKYLSSYINSPSILYYFQLLIQQHSLDCYTNIIPNFKSSYEQYMNNKKQPRSENTSLSTFTHSTENSEATKKAMSTEEISMETFPSHIESISSHKNIILPFQINIKSLIKHLLLKLEEKGTIVLHSDQVEGEILVQKKVRKNCWTSLLDCCCLCRKEGWPQGSITQSYEAVSILIKRQYIEKRSKIRVRANCPQEKASTNLLFFVQEIIDLIRNCLQSFKDTQQERSHVEINEESPLAMEIAANEQAYKLFISNESQDKRFTTLFNTALQKINNEIKTLQKENAEQRNEMSSENNEGRKANKKKGMKVYSVMQMIVNETDNLFQFCQQLGLAVAPGFHPDYAIYSIESLICYHSLTSLLNLYKNDLTKECEQFSKNSEYINKNLTAKQYFDYLEVRPKFRLQSSEQPYDLAINALRKLETSLTIRQILLCVQQTFSLIKVCCLYEHEGKLDISSMDDILPVMIYVAARAQVVDFPVYVKIIDDYVKIRGVFELEERVITTLYVATEDICSKTPSLNKP